MDEKEWERRCVCGEEAVTRKGGFGDEERDGWRFLCCRFCRWIRAIVRTYDLGNAWRFGLGGVGYAGGGGGGVSEYDALELAQVCGAHLPLFSFALREDA